MSMYLVARLGAKYGHLQRATELLSDIVRFAERRGWKLLVAYQNTVGDLNEIIDIWEVPDANCVTEGLAGVFGDPEFAPAFAELREVILYERLSLHSRLPYSP
jgi:hypothetical protein